MSNAGSGLIYWPNGGGFVSPLAHVAEGAYIGIGSIICAEVTVPETAKIGERCHIDNGAVLGENITIGDECVVEGLAQLEGDQVIETHTCCQFSGNRYTMSQWEIDELCEMCDMTATGILAE